jgi:hypothetical protein
MAKGLFSSLYGKTEEGIFNKLYSHNGTMSRVQRTDIRLAGLGQEEDEDEEPDTPAPPAPAGPKESVFEKEYEGIPLWVIGIFFLGFGVAYRKLKKANAA